MKVHVNPLRPFARTSRPAVPGQPRARVPPPIGRPSIGRPSISTSPIGRPAVAQARINANPIQNIRAQQLTSPGPNRPALQPRGLITQPARSNPAAIQRRPVSPPSQPTSQAPNYILQAPMHLGGRNQQIRATIRGTPQVAGSVEITPRGGGQVHISNLSVEQQHRRRGVAAQLIDAAITTARRQGFRAASLEARPSDNGISPQALVAMYRRKGFRNVGQSKRGSPLMERAL